MVTLVLRMRSEIVGDVWLKGLFIWQQKCLLTIEIMKDEV
jgi:hypothetical protein